MQIEKLWTRKIPETKETRTNVHKQIFVFDDFGLQSLSILILWFDLRKVCICGCVIDPKGRWAWSKDERSSRAVDLILKVDLSGSSKGLLGLIFEEQWWTDLQGLLGLILKNGWMCGFVDVCWSKGRRGLILEERWTKNEEHFLQGPSGLDLELVDDCWSKGPLGLDLRMNDERRTLSWFFGNLDAWELRSFRASELQGVISIPPLNEWNGLVFIEFSKA